MDQNPEEFLIVGNRIVHVRGEDGDSVVSHCKVLDSKNKSCVVAMWTGIAHDKKQTPTYYKISKIDDDEILIELAVDRYAKDPRRIKRSIPHFRCKSNNTGIPAYGKAIEPASAIDTF